MAKIAVTGGCGFIGSHIVEQTCRENRVTVLDNLHSGSRANIETFIAENGVRLIEGSIMDDHALDKALHGAETVFHLGALISVPESMDRKIRYVEVNTIGTLRVLEAARRAGARNFIHSSSAAVYGDDPRMPKREDMAPDPVSPYAVSKLDGEYYCRLYRREYGLNAVALRYFNVFGPRQDPASQYAAAIPIFVSRAVRGDDVTVYGDGEQTRDFIFVEDVVRANLAAARYGGDVVNVARGECVSINELLTRILAVTASTSRVIYKPERPGDIRHSLADNSRLCRDLKCPPSSDLEIGLEATVNYFAGLFRESE